ncbi:hypothetical protein [Lentilactobacillus buchneri]|uniref:hypothetical protein n=1 Tax=Lentilactobacillus buchneri TaxID=1581 RepID=UPI001291699E|nr:hypothetical protein [Lentilactobacillus buchneri]MQM78812.1 hypothetical protein [Lentilactobacillus buchneri]MQM88866.1 hypothetical protein [Lentilactobacillus buchneri]MQN21015.1 hypothetical protein [Lentilactobacillus buchneri]
MDNMKILDTSTHWETQPLPDAISIQDNFNLGSKKIVYKNCDDLIIFQGSLTFLEEFSAGKQYILFNAPTGYSLGGVQGATVGSINNMVFSDSNHSYGVSTTKISYKLSISSNQLLITMVDSTDHSYYGFKDAGDLDLTEFRVLITKNKS